MRKSQFLFIALALLLSSLCSCSQGNKEMQRNKEIATKYHDLNTNDIDVILTDNFIGRHAKSLFTWNKEDHRKYLSNGESKKDSIINQIAEGNWVATRFIRTGIRDGKPASVEVMHLKRFENGKIVEIWEYYGCE